MSDRGSQQSGSNAGSQAEANEPKGPENPLTEEVLQAGLSMIKRTANGASYAFSTLTLEEKELDDLGGDMLSGYQHLINASFAKNVIPDISVVQFMTHLLQLNASENKI